MAVSYPLYGSPTRGRSGFSLMNNDELFFVSVVAMVVSAGLFVALALVALAEAWWYRRHGLAAPDLTTLRRRIWQRFALYWLALSFLETAALFIIVGLPFVF